jgi:hypothetical protein
MWVCAYRVKKERGGQVCGRRPLAALGVCSVFGCDSLDSRHYEACKQCWCLTRTRAGKHCAGAYPADACTTQESCGALVAAFCQNLPCFWWRVTPVTVSLEGPDWGWEWEAAAARSVCQLSLSP